MDSLRWRFIYLAQVCATVVLAFVVTWAQAAEPVLAEQVRALALAGAQRQGNARVEVEVGPLDPRLRLAPCERVEPYLPTGTRLWGRTRIGLRCTQGVSHWNVYLPVTVKMYGTALVAATPLAAGSVIAEGDLRTAEVDLAAAPGQAFADAQRVVGRTVARAIPAGEAVRDADLKVRQWFAAGETVRVVAQGAGFAVAGEGQALMPGVEGQPVRVKTESGRVLTGMPVGERRVELSL
jgi:flagella basal body P-ring formation protein FlgA